MVSLLMYLAVNDAGAAEPPPRVGIIGEDDRRILTESGAPWDAIGRVERGGRGFCTGVLISASEVLTAAHCLWNPERRRLHPASSLHFVAGFRRGEFKAHAPVRASRTDERLAFDDVGRPNGLAHDWAILTLARPIERVEPVTLPVDMSAPDLSAGDALVRAGYGRDRAFLPTVVDNCKVLRVRADEPLMLHDCDATFGDSGSPLLTRQDAGWLLVGLQVAVVQHEGTPAGAAILASTITSTAGAR